jgi:hypothetical protein
VIVTNERGGRLTAPLDVTTDVAWVGIANGELRDQLWPVLLAVLARHGLGSQSGAAHVAD